MYNSRADNRYVTMEEILSQLTQEQIFLLVFDDIKEFGYITSPFRDDNNPGCWFERYNNKLYFIDFGSGTRNSIDCFEAIKIFYNLNNLREVLLFLDDNIDGIREKTKEYTTRAKIEEKQKANKIINIKTRDYYDIDRKYWEKYEISKQNLIDDKVFAISHLQFIVDREQKCSEVYDVCYGFTDFENQHKKIYFPYRKDKKKRFLSTCNENDIGNINQMNPFDKKLVITKSYKDCRVLRNQGINSIWFQNEGCFPDKEIIFPLINHYEDIIVFYDNDNTGIKASKEIANIIYSELNKGRVIHLPINLLQNGISDISDLIVKDKKKVVEFLRNNKVYEST
jgi:DNA primase